MRIVCALVSAVSIAAFLVGCSGASVTPPLRLGADMYKYRQPPPGEARSLREHLRSQQHANTVRSSQKICSCSAAPATSFAKRQNKKPSMTSNRKLSSM